MSFSHILITRPLHEATELAAALAGVAAQPVILPAYDFHAKKLPPDQLLRLQRSGAVEHEVLLIFSSPRAVQFGLGQVPPQTLQKADLAAIGPATASSLEQAGRRVSLRPERGFSSEDLLALLPAEQAGRRGPVYIFAAPGGRTQLSDELLARGYASHMMMVYERRPVDLAPAALARLHNADHILSVWTSANAMQSLAQRMPGIGWSRICQGEWLVISERLERLARAFHPARIHRAAGPSNAELVAAVQKLV